MYHAAGNDGRGSSSYIDSVILRDKDANTDWDVAADGTLEERMYYLQNWRHDVVGLIDASGGGQQVEQVRYEAYGMPWLLPAGDTDSDGDLDTTDTNQIQSWIDAAQYDVKGDLDLDGDVDSTDKTISLNSTATYGKIGIVSHPDYANRKGYAGYEYDNQFNHASYHVRNRVLNSTLGQWTRRDPLGYIDSLSFYTITRSNPITYSDPAGQAAYPTISNNSEGSDAGCSVPEPSPNPHPVDCCDAMRHECGDDDNDGELDGGGVVCCDGKKVSCVFFEGEGPGAHIIGGCTLEHEDDHHDDVDCCACPSGRVCRPPWKKYVSPDVQECLAFKVGIKCLQRRRGECSSIPPYTPAQIEECKDLIDANIRQQCRMATRHCGVRPPFCP